MTKPSQKKMKPAKKAEPDKAQGNGRRFGLIGLLIIVAGGLLYWVSDDSDADVMPNVLLVTFDTTRVDRFGCYGYQPIKTPAVDGLAEEGVRYARCYSPAPLTMPSHTTMMTGFYPFYHKIMDNGEGPLDPKVNTLAEVLKEQGYDTAAVIAAFVLDSRWGLDQGFDLYEDDVSKMEREATIFYPDRRADAIADIAVDWLGKRTDKPYFLWTHYFDPHFPYAPPGFTGTPNRANFNEYVGLYDQEIEFADSQTARVLKKARELEEQTGRPTLIIFAADHGESLFQHDEPTHGWLAYNSTLHVPLIVRFPDKRKAGTVVTTQVGLVDLYPSILGWLGLELPYEVHGYPLPTTRNGPRGDPDNPDPFYFESYSTLNMMGWAPLEGAIWGDHKFIKSPKAELFNLADDVQELDNLHDSEPEMLQIMKSKFLEILERKLDAPNLEIDQLLLDAETMKKLEALGYAGSSAEVSEEDSELLPDPKDMVHLATLVSKAAVSMDGDLENGLPNLRRLLEADPNNRRGFKMLVYLLNDPVARRPAIGILQERMKAPLADHLQDILPDSLRERLDRTEWTQEESEALVLKALQNQPDNVIANYRYAQMLLIQGEPATRALPFFEKAYYLSPENPEYADALVGVYRLLGRSDDALKVYDITLGRKPNDPTVLNNWAWLHFESDGNMPLALERSRQVVKMRPNNGQFRHTLGCLLMKTGSLSEALVELNQAVNLDDSLAEAHYHLGTAHQQNESPASARKAFEKAIELGESRNPIWLEDAKRRLAELG